MLLPTCLTGAGPIVAGRLIAASGRFFELRDVGAVRHPCNEAVSVRSKASLVFILDFFKRSRRQ